MRKGKNKITKITAAAVLAAAFIFAACAAFADAPKQMMVVTPKLPKGSAVIEFYEKQNDDHWKLTIKTRGFVGKNGVTLTKREGDGCTPVGVFVLDRPFGIAPNPGTKLPYRQVTSADAWVDDVRSQFYNRWVDVNAVPRTWRSAEYLSLETVAYKYAAVIEYNTEPVVPGSGSAIFLHVSKGRPTAGCVSMPEEKVAAVLQRIEKGALIVIRNSAD
jgi:L,D-peptidoglycan transpeptidase YkuD (ErfK/YbiS/YcfS/YnhG family)